MENWKTVTAQINEIPILKDITFWHLLGTTACGLLIKVLNKHLEKTETTLQRVTEILNSVVTKNELQEFQISNHEQRLKKLEDK